MLLMKKSLIPFVTEAIAIDAPWCFLIKGFVPTMQVIQYALLVLAGRLSYVHQKAQEPGLALILLQWWFDAIKAGYHGKGLEEPVLQALIPSCLKVDIPFSRFEQFIEAIRGQKPITLEDWIAFHEQTTANLAEMAAMLCGATSVGILGAGEAGLGYALVGQGMRSKNDGIDTTAMVQYGTKAIHRAMALKKQYAPKDRPFALGLGHLALSKARYNDDHMMKRPRPWTVDIKTMVKLWRVF
jgi:hypothetical protein